MTIINYICEDHLGVICVGTENGGLYKFDREKEQFINIENRHISLKTNIKNIYEDHLGFLWIGQEETLHKYNRDNNTFEIFKNDPQNPSSLSNNYIKFIYEDRSETLWVGTDGGGLEKFIRETKQFIHFTHDPSDSNSISNNFINVIYEDKMGRFWIGTQGGGLNLFDRKEELFTCYKEKDGLPNNVVYGILEDESGNLWLSTNNGLSKFNPETKTFKNFTVNDGLQGLEFHEFSFCKSKQTGEMFFGGSNGFNAFFPDSLKENLFTPSIRIVDFLLFNESISVGKNQNERTILKSAITETNEIELTHKDNVFSFEFAALHYSSPENNQYAYMMEGFEKKWNYVNNRRNATYTNLPAGNYIFRVKGSNNNGIWNEEGTSIKIRVTPPFWKTGWFRTFLVILILGSIYSFYRWRMKSAKKQQWILEQTVEERTAALREANKEIKNLAGIFNEKSILLAASSGEFTENNMSIASQLSTIASSVQEMAATIHKMAEFSDRTKELATTGMERTDASSRDLSKVVDENKVIIQDIRQFTDYDISELETKNREIVSVVRVIEDVADQTNLLALNAAIEAASAGEAGRGFSVVAEEIRQLSEKTSSSTKEIAEKVRAIQTSSKNVVKGLTEKVSRLVEISGQIVKTEESVKGSNKDINTISDEVTNIATAIQQQSSVADAISNNIQSVQQNIESNTRVVTNLTGMAEELEDVSRKLTELLEQSKEEA